MAAPNPRVGCAAGEATHAVQLIDYPMRNVAIIVQNSPSTKEPYTFHLQRIKCTQLIYRNLYVYNQTEVMEGHYYPATHRQKSVCC